jgi:hypothetical protein
LAPTEITGVDKILVSTKYWRRQNTGADKIWVPTKYWRRQNVGADAEGSAESTAADFSQTLLKISYVSLMVLIPLRGRQV